MARKMKDSGIEWVGMIPQDWELVKGKYLFRQRNEKGNSIDLQLLSPTQKYGVIPQHLYEELSGMTTVKLDLNADYSSLKSIYKGDFCISLRSFQGGFEYSRYNGVVSPAYQVFCKTQDLCDLYYAYLFKEKSFIDRMTSYTRSFRDGKNIAFSDFGNSIIPVPPLPEQRRIASFLDAKCALIDAAIDKTRASIEEYKKLKQAIITEAVTKGVRGKKRRMKDSGIEWIGEIPEEWGLVKVLRGLAMPITDGPHTTPDLYDNGIAFVSAEAVSCGNGEIDFNHIRGYISEEFYFECCKKYTPAIDDVYMIKSGATTGRVAIVTTLEPRFTIWSPLAVFRCNTNVMLSKYLYYQLQSSWFQKQIELSWTYGTQQNIGMRVLEQLKVTFPPLSEQKEIALFINDKLKSVDRIIENKSKEISDLELYKKSLIYEYVTGKKEVPA